MKLLTFFLMLVVISNKAYSQRDELAVQKLLLKQSEFWNKGDIDGFMEGYWKNDSLMFIGKKGITRGWKATLENYKKGYPDTASMGKLRFELVEIRKLSTEYVYVTGHWQLTRTLGDLSGMFTLLLKKLKGKWVIIRDHSS